MMKVLSIHTIHTRKILFEISINAKSIEYFLCPEEDYDIPFDDYAIDGRDMKFINFHSLLCIVIKTNHKLNFIVCAYFFLSLSITVHEITHIKVFTSFSFVPYQISSANTVLVCVRRSALGTRRYTFCALIFAF